MSQEIRTRAITLVLIMLNTFWLGFNLANGPALATVMFGVALAINLLTVWAKTKHRY